MAAWKSLLLFAGVALVPAASAKEDLSVHRDVVCKTYRAPRGGAHPIHSSLSSVVHPAVASVSDKFNVLDIAVGLNISHPDVGALRVSLEAREPCAVHHNALTQSSIVSKVSCVDAEARQTRLLASYGGCVVVLGNSGSMPQRMRDTRLTTTPPRAPTQAAGGPVQHLLRRLRRARARQGRP